MALSLRAWNNAPTKEACSLVLSIIKSQPVAPTVQEIFKLAVQRELELHKHSPAPPAPPPTTTPGTPQAPPLPRYPNHAIRSMRYLKDVVLPSLLSSQDVRRVHRTEQLPEEEIKRRLNASRSSRKQASNIQTSIDVWRFEYRRRPLVPPKLEEQEPYGADVGVGADWSHLNKRRRRARELSVKRDVQWVRQLDRARKEGRSTRREAAEDVQIL
ncbi:hypothetical protein WOLCODRAFT_139388 [Wolfiporia cocos MD-104 SS10]|uniref:Uncharacterized protein n=1 Tax=Wolfiporia cocos (strain MD-104) TaxID=742152 RepID=A0A2H3K7Q8_WOLCO|nr:hypothetical protein WOLCODRAFT_139388 [Wolfiporia cocos MD-104 SS10]